MQHQINAILLIGHGSRDPKAVTQYHQFAGQLAQRLAQPVVPCFLEFADPPIVEGIRACIERGAKNIVALPLFLGAAGHQKNDVPAIINWAKKEWPDLKFRYGTPLGAQIPLVNTLAHRAQEAIAEVNFDTENIYTDQETALVVVGRGSRDPDSNAEVARIARLLYEGRTYGWVEHAFYSLTTPKVPDMIERCIRLGAKRVIILPYLLFTGRIDQRIGEQAAAVQQNYPDVQIHTAHHLGAHEGVIEAVVQRWQEVTDGTAAMTCDLCKYRVQITGFEDEFGLPQGSDHNHGLRGVPHGHGFEEKLATLLPPRYQNGNGSEVSAAPMGAADLKFGESGSVAWDEMWEDFCDLALAGGPSHRGELLEPIDPKLVRLNPSGYAQVLAELARGITLITQMPIVESRSPGWIGVACDHEEMAIWLLRAIIVENIFARREENVLYFPAGPHFQLANEIKSIITVVAKTHHYWIEHMSNSPINNSPIGNSAVNQNSLTTPSLV